MQLTNLSRRTMRCEYYVRDVNASSPTTEEVLAVVLAINTSPMMIVNVKLPVDEGILTVEQYRRLPDHIRRLFVRRERDLELLGA